MCHEKDAREKERVEEATERREGGGPASMPPLSRLQPKFAPERWFIDDPKSREFLFQKFDGNVLM